jgi:hypothetical protein
MNLVLEKLFLKDNFFIRHSVFTEQLPQPLHKLLKIFFIIFYVTSPFCFSLSKHVTSFVSSYTSFNDVTTFSLRRLFTASTFNDRESFQCSSVCSSALAFYTVPKIFENENFHTSPPLIMNLTPITIMNMLIPLNQIINQFSHTFGIVFNCAMGK